MGMFTVKEVASELHVSRPTVYRLINEGKLPAIVVSGVKIRSLRIQQKALEEYIEGHKTQVKKIIKRKKVLSSDG